MKFIHAGDVHLDSALAGLSAHEDAPLDLLRSATRRAFTNLIDRAIAERVAFVLFPGDLFDTGWRDFETGIFFMGQIARLHEAKIDAYVLRGNHDADEDMIRALVPPPNLHLFASDAPQTFHTEVEGLRVALHGQSFKRADIADNLAAGYRPAEGCFNIALLHTALGGGYSEHEDYAPCSLDELQNKGMHYWALGHVHEHAVLSAKPYVCFSGNAQGRHVREPGARGALLVTVKHGIVQPPERLFVDVLRWQHLAVDVGGAATMDEAMGRVGAAFGVALDTADNRPVAARVSLTGKTAVHRELTGQPRMLRQNVQAQAMYKDPKNLWIEKIEVATAPPRDAAAIAARADGIADLQTLLAEAATDTDFIESLTRDFGPMLNKLPREAFVDRDVLTLARVAANDFAPLIAEAIPSLLNRVEQEG